MIEMGLAIYSLALSVPHYNIRHKERGWMFKEYPIASTFKKSLGMLCYFIVPF